MSLTREATEALRKLVTYGYSNLDRKKKWIIADFQKSSQVSNDQMEHLLSELNNKVLS